LPTEQQFVELTRSYLETLLKTKDLVEEDLVYREVVLNLRAGNDAVSAIKLNPPYNLMVDFSENTMWSREERTSRTYCRSVAPTPYELSKTKTKTRQNPITATVFG